MAQDNQSNEDTTNMSYQMLPKDARWDERILHFLKELPAWVIILLALGILLWVWQRTAAENIGRLIDMVVASLLTALVSNRIRPQQPSVDNSISAETIKTPIVKTDTMPDATVNLNRPEDLDIADEESSLDITRGLEKGKS